MGLNAAYMNLLDKMIWNGCALETDKHKAAAAEVGGPTECWT